MKMFKAFIIAIVLSLISTTVIYAASNTKEIKVIISDLKYMFDGVQKVPATGKGFIYEGTTYVPLRFVSEAMGKEVSWDGKNQTIWIGKKLGEFKYLSDIEYARTDGNIEEDRSLFFDEWKNPAGLKFTIAGNQYLKGIGTILAQYDWYEAKGSIDYNLNGQYEKLSGIAGIDDYTKNSDNVGGVIFIADGKEVHRISNLKGGDLPTSFEIDLKGTLKLQIQFEAIKGNGHIDIVLGELKIQ